MRTVHAERQGKFTVVGQNPDSHRAACGSSPFPAGDLASLTQSSDLGVAGSSLSLNLNLD